MNDPQRLDSLRKAYRLKMAAADEIVVAAMLEAYEAVTGKRPSDRFREKITDAVIYDQ